MFDTLLVCGWGPLLSGTSRGGPGGQEVRHRLGRDGVKSIAGPSPYLQRTQVPSSRPCGERGALSGWFCPLCFLLVPCSLGEGCAVTWEPAGSWCETPLRARASAVDCGCQRTFMLFVEGGLFVNGVSGLSRAAAAAPPSCCAVGRRERAFSFLGIGIRWGWLAPGDGLGSW